MNEHWIVFDNLNIAYPRNCDARADARDGVLAWAEQGRQVLAYFHIFDIFIFVFYSYTWLFLNVIPNISVIHLTYKIMSVYHRDSYVRILWDNIMTGMEYNFLK